MAPRVSSSLVAPRVVIVSRGSWPLACRDPSQGTMGLTWRHTHGRWGISVVVGPRVSWHLVLSSSSLACRGPSRCRGPWALPVVVGLYAWLLGHARGRWAFCVFVWSATWLFVAEPRSGVLVWFTVLAYGKLATTFVVAGFCAPCWPPISWVPPCVPPSCTPGRADLKWPTSL